MASHRRSAPSPATHSLSRLAGRCPATRRAAASRQCTRMSALAALRVGRVETHKQRELRWRGALHARPPFRYVRPRSRKCRMHRCANRAISGTTFCSMPASPASTKPTLLGTRGCLGHVACRHRCGRVPSEGIDDRPRAAFSVCLLSHNRPMAEVLAVRAKRTDQL